MGNIKHWLLAASSGVILAIAWPETFFEINLLIFFGLSPLLMLEDKLSKNHKSPGKAVFSFSYLTFIVFNLITTWWIYFASAWGAVAAIVFNSLFMAVVFWLFHITKQKVGRKEGYISLVIYWVAFEYLHLNWDLSWPWLTLGNVFSNSPENVQWFEYTGVLGGTLWVLISNLIFFFYTRRDRKNSVKSNLMFVFLLAFVFGPMFWSKSVYNNYALDSNGEVDVVIIQPNIDPYKDKFSGMAESDQIDLMVDLAREKVDEETDLLVLPETAFPQAYWEHEVEFLYGTEELRKIINEYPQLRIVTGLSTSRLFLEGEELPPTARKLGDVGHYDNYNTAMQLDSSELVSFHRKSKLVLGVEKVPFIKYVPFMKKLSIDLGGAAGGYGSQEHPNVFFNENKNKGIAPIICYESVYGEYVNEYAQQGAQLYAIITNDGWWDNSPGYKQHLAYARLRAVEGRRNIVRSANTGISAIINSRGEIVKRTEWWVPTAMKGKVQLNDEITFYIKYGDYLGRIAAFVAVLLVLLTIVKTLNKTEQRLNAGKK